MSPEQGSPRRELEKRAGLLRRLLPVMIGLTVLAVVVNVCWWFSKPSLEPLPIVATDRMTPRIRMLIQEATAQVMRHNDSAAAWGDLGAIYFVHTMTPEAAACFRNAERLDPADYRWPYLLGISVLNTDGEQALDCYRRSAQRCGNKAHVQLRLAEALIDKGELEEAAVQVESVLGHAPSNPRVQFAKARLLLAQGDLEQAKSWAMRSAAAAPDKRTPHLLVAQLCRRTQDAAGEERALKALEKFADDFTAWEDPDTAALYPLRQDGTARLARAEDLAKSGQTATLKETLSEIATGSDGAAATSQLAWILDQEGNYRASEALLRHQLLRFPNDERLHFQLGVVGFLQEKYPEAEAAFRRVVELKPDFVDAWYNLGLTLLKLEKPGDARVAFAAAVRLSPSKAVARINLAELLLADGRYKEAREHLEAAIKVAPEEKLARELLQRAKAGGK